MKRSLSLCWIIPVLFVLHSCSSVKTLTAAQNPCSLPVTRGCVGYKQFVGKREIDIGELFIVARAWVRDHAAYYTLQPEKPVFKKTLLYSAVIPYDRIDPDRLTYASRPSVVFFLTVDAEKDTFSVFLSNYRVSVVHRSDVDLETMLTDTTICRAVDRESREVLRSLSDYLRERNQRLSN